MRVEDMDGEVRMGGVQLVDELFMLRGVDCVPEGSGAGGDGFDIGGCGVATRQLGILGAEETYRVDEVGRPLLISSGRASLRAFRALIDLGIYSSAPVWTSSSPDGLADSPR
jgi:hypothetical protein